MCPPGATVTGTPGFNTAVAPLMRIRSLRSCVALVRRNCPATLNTLEHFQSCWTHDRAANSVCSLPPLWGRGGEGGSCCEAILVHHRTTPTPPAFAALRRATLPTRGRVETELAARVSTFRAR